MQCGAHVWRIMHVSAALPQCAAIFCNLLRLRARGRSTSAVPAAAGSPSAPRMHGDGRTRLHGNGRVHTQEATAAVMEYVLEPFSQRGFYKGVLADLPATKDMVYSAHTAAVHMTGASATYEAILWGTGVRLRSLRMPAAPPCMHDVHA
jgi:hypothetical protein